MSKHTEGPWKIEMVNHAPIQKPFACYLLSDANDEFSIGLLSSWQDNLNDVNEAYANARLIAAAPDLLEALKSALAELDCYAWTHHPKGADGAQAFNLVRSNALAAIAKATGESK